MVATLLGVFSGSAYKANLTLAIYLLPRQPIRYATIYSIATTVAILVSLVAPNRSRPLASRFLEILPRVAGGFALGFTPYSIDRPIALVAAKLGASITTIPSPVWICGGICAGALVSVAVETLVRACIRYFAKPVVRSNDP